MKLKIYFVTVVIVITTILTTAFVSATPASDLSAKLAAAKIAMPDGSTLSGYDSATECMGFGMWLYYQLWGTTVRNEPNSRKHRNAANLCVGDYVRYYFHSIIVIDIQGDTVVYVDQNGGPTYNLVKWGRTITKRDLQQKLDAALPGEYLTPDGYGFIVNHAGNTVKSLSYSPYGYMHSYYPAVTGVAADVVDYNRTVLIDIYLYNKDEGNKQYGGAWHIPANLPEGNGNSKKFSWSANWDSYPTGNYEIIVVALSGPGPAQAEIGRSVVSHKSPADRLEGHLDEYKNIINGWAYDTSLPNDPINADISIQNTGGATVAGITISANKMRGDLVPAGKGNGLHGFEWNFDWTILSDGQYKVIAYAENNGIRKYIGEFNDKKYNLMFHNNDGSGVVQTRNKWEGDTFMPPVLTRDGYDFVGWATSAAATTAKYAAGIGFTSNADLTFYGVWRKVYNITYDLNGGAGVLPAQKKTHGVDINLHGSSPERDGYAFRHWTDWTTTYMPGDTYSVDADLQLTAIWELNTYEIRFITGGGVWSGPEVVTKKHGVPYQLSLLEPEMAGKIFAGWYAASTSEKEYAPGDMLEENTNVDLTALWCQSDQLIPGDINDDGVVDLADVSLGMQILVGISIELPVGMAAHHESDPPKWPPSGWYARGNVDGEPGFTANDIRIILGMCTQNALTEGQLPKLLAEVIDKYGIEPWKKDI